MRDEEEEKREIMDKLIKITDRNYLDCNYYRQWHRVLFWLTILFNLGQAMSFNSVIDIPSLILILIFQSSFAFRKNYPKEFTKFYFFIVYFLQFSLALKMHFVLLSEISLIKNYILVNSKDSLVWTIQMIFGLDFKF